MGWESSDVVRLGLGPLVFPVDTKFSDALGLVFLPIFLSNYRGRKNLF